MEADAEFNIYPPGCQVIRYGILDIVNGLEPGVGRHVLYFEQVEDLGADPGIFRKAEKMF